MIGEYIENFVLINLMKWAKLEIMLATIPPTQMDKVLGINKLPDLIQGHVDNLNTPY